uniref:(3R)-3-hydroxyacyl-CoA dehydrogenase n=1 Tax=Ixodes ricinus TaxID=34613 RepID=A0A6B0V814_IXORI
MLHFPFLSHVIGYLLLCCLCDVLITEGNVSDTDAFADDGVSKVKRVPKRLLEGKVAIVTGGASGIGRSVCQVLAREGANVIIADINETGSNETLGLLNGSGHMQLYTDVSVIENVTYLFKEVEEKYNGTIDIVVNSAGIVNNVSLVSMVREEEFDKVIQVNLRGTYLVTQAAVTSMLKINTTGRAILNIASVAGKGGNPYVSAYSASKGAVISFTKSVALEVALFGIRVNTILPGFTDTPMTQGISDAAKQNVTATIPMMRMATPLEISETIVFMCGPRGTYMTGSTVLVSGGWYI